VADCERLVAYDKLNSECMLIW